MKSLAFVLCLLAFSLQTDITSASDNSARKNDSTGYVQMSIMMEAEEDAEELLNLKDVQQSADKTIDNSSDSNTLSPETAGKSDDCGNQVLKR